MGGSCGLSLAGTRAQLECSLKFIFSYSAMGLSLYKAVWEIVSW